MSFAVVIPARYASSRLPGKPLAEIAGTAMVVHVARRAREAGATPVVVATDHQGIADCARAHGFEAEITRTDHASGTDRIAEVAERRGWDGARVVVNVQGDEPLIEPALIREVARALAADAQAAIATACCPIRDPQDFINPNVVKVVLDRQRRALYFSRASIPYPRDFAPDGIRALPKELPVFRHIGIYGYRASFLAEYAALEPAAIEKFESLEQLRALWHGYRIVVALAASTPHAGVDTPEDLQRVRQLIAGTG